MKNTTVFKVGDVIEIEHDTNSFGERVIHSIEFSEQEQEFLAWTKPIGVDIPTISEMVVFNLKYCFKKEHIVTNSLTDKQ
jgi:hypothetical protein